MRSFDDFRTGGHFRRCAGLTLALALGACDVGGSASNQLAAAPAPLYGPQADYPVVVGEPYRVAGIAYTPEDVLNYDQVGFIAADPAGGGAASGAHHTLPLPSYVEVTSLETGRTILVRVERRGPMDSNALLALSDGAMSQLGATPNTPVRVRRVNPPEDQRALLRAGAPADPRIDTPMSLVEILKRKLPGPGASGLAIVNVSPEVAATPTSPQPVMVAIEANRPIRATGSAPALPPLDGAATIDTSPTQPSEPVPTANGAFVVQAAAFSTAERARDAASALDGKVSQSGAYWRVRTGPFATRKEAEASLAKVRSAGYRDARIFTSG